MQQTDSLYVDPATRERILQIIEEQGFVPSIPASGLASGRRSLIGMLVPSWIWPLIPELMRGVAEVIELTPYELVLYSINNADLKKDRSEVINRVLATQLTAGLLAVYPGEASQDLTRLYNQGFPVVIIDDQRGQTTPWVGADTDDRNVFQDGSVGLTIKSVWSLTASSMSLSSGSRRCLCH